MAISHENASEVTPEKWEELCKKLAGVIGGILNVSVSLQLVEREEYRHLADLLEKAVSEFPDRYRNPHDAAYWHFASMRQLRLDALNFIRGEIRCQENPASASSSSPSREKDSK